ncbi:uncharacterized protein ISCGN_002329 [Ixodes scapularis]
MPITNTIELVVHKVMTSRKEIETLVTAVGYSSAGRWSGCCADCQHGRMPLSRASSSFRSVTEHQRNRSTCVAASAIARRRPPSRQRAARIPKDGRGGGAEGKAAAIPPFRDPVPPRTSSFRRQRTRTATHMQLRRDAQQRVSMPRTDAPEVDMTMEDQATEQSAPLSFTADACTMTEEEGTLFSPCTMFLCCNVGQDAATFVCHNVTKDKGSGPDQVSFQDKGVGPAYKEPCFTGYDCVRHDEAKLIVRSCTWTRFVQTQQ